MIAEKLTEAEALELLAIRKKLGLDPEPVKGAHTGGGRHVPMPEEWNGEGKVPPGWAGVSGVFEQEDGFAVEVIEFSKTDESKLSAPELLKYDAAVKAEKAKLTEAPSKEVEVKAPK